MRSVHSPWTNCGNCHFFIILKITFVLVCTILISSCDIVNPPIKIPAYIQLDSFSFETDEKTGFNTHKITDAWIFVNGQQIGVYSIPTNPIPALAEGNAKISILAGVYADGISANRIYYPFYKSYTETKVLEKGKVAKVYPKFRYDSSLKKPFVYYQDFEKSDSGFSMGRFGNIPLQIASHIPSDPIAAFGNRYAILKATTADDIIEYSNNIWVSLNESGMPVYLEFDYKATCNIEVGIIGRKASGQIQTSYDLILKPNDNWTKMYVNLTDEVGDFRPERKLKYRFFLRTSSQAGIGNSLSIDNLRLINFPE